MKFRPALILALAVACHGAPAQDEEAEYPFSRAAVRLMLDQANDTALQAQAQHFPEHYDALISQLVDLKRNEDPQQASLALAQASHQNWARYNELVRQGDPADWRELVLKRRDLFALIGNTDGPDQCLAYEYRGAQTLTDSGNPAYREPVSAYIALFIDSAARGRSTPRKWREARPEDLDLLYATLEAHGTDPELMSALRPGNTVHPRFCDAMVAVMDGALTLDGESGSLVWRFLVTTEGTKPEP